MQEYQSVADLYNLGTAGFSNLLGLKSKNDDHRHNDH